MLMKSYKKIMIIVNTKILNSNTSEWQIILKRDFTIVHEFRTM